MQKIKLTVSLDGKQIILSVDVCLLDMAGKKMRLLMLTDVENTLHDTVNYCVMHCM